MLVQKGWVCIYIYIYIFLYWPGCPMFFILLATMHYRLIFYLTLFIYVGLNHYTIFSSYHDGGYLSNHFQSLKYHLITVPVHLFSEPCNMSSLTELLLSMHSTPLHFQIISLQMCLCNDIPSMDISLTLCHNQYLFFLLNSSPYSLVCIMGKTVYWRDWHIRSCPALHWAHHLLW